MNKYILLIAAIGIICSCGSGSNNGNDNETNKIPVSEELNERLNRIKENSEAETEHQKNQELIDQLNSVANSIGKEQNGGYYPTTDDDYLNSESDGYENSPCQVCNMTGECQVCRGTGQVEVKVFGLDEMQPQNCRACNGTRRCEGCAGSGYIR